MLYGLSTGFFSTEFSFDPRKMMPRIARCGFDFAHVSLDTAFVQKGKAWWSELKQICDDCNLIFDPGMGLGPDMDVSSDDPAVRQKGVDYLLALIEAVQYMGGHRLEGINFVGLGAFDGEINRAKRWENSVESVKIIMKACEQADIRFGMELCNRNEQFLINTIEDGVRFCEDVGSPNLGFCLDVYHMAMEEDSFMTRLFFPARARTIFMPASPIARRLSARDSRLGRTYGAASARLDTTGMWRWNPSPAPAAAV